MAACVGYGFIRTPVSVKMSRNNKRDKKKMKIKSVHTICISTSLELDTLYAVAHQLVTSYVVYPFKGTDSGANYLVLIS